MNQSQEKIFNHIAQELVDIKLHMKYLNGIFIDHPGERKRAVLDMASPIFFHLTFHLFYNHILLSLSKLIDPPEQRGSENLSIKNLIKKLQPLPSSISSDVDALMNQIEQALGNAIKQHRNKRIAHNDLDTKLQAGQLPRVTENDLYLSIQGFEKLMNIISKHYFNRERDYESNVSHSNTPSTLIEIIRRGIEKH